jgi:hypothetical protein
MAVILLHGNIFRMYVDPGSSDVMRGLSFEENGADVQ